MCADTTTTRGRDAAQVRTTVFLKQLGPTLRLASGENKLTFQPDSPNLFEKKLKLIEADP